MGNRARKLATLTGLALLHACVAACPEREKDTASTPPPTPEGPDPIDDDGPPPLPDVFGGWTATPHARGGFVVGRSFATLVQMSHLAFGANWKWAGPIVEPAAPVGGVHEFTLKTELGVDGTARVAQTSPRALEVKIAYDVPKPLSAVSGVGMQFELDLGSSAWPSPPGRPDLLPDAGGFTVSLEQRESLDVKYEGPGRVFFERKNPGKIRILMLEGKVAAGRYEGTVTVSLPTGGRVMPSAAERYAATSEDGWVGDTVAWNDWPVDVSFLSDGDRPAGKHGRLRADGEALVFEDGTPARFWGTNVSARALFDGEPDAVAQQARRLAALGFNLVRLHHHDAGWIPSNVFDGSAGTTQKLDAAALAHLDRWIEALTKEGIYVWVDLHVGRRFVAGDGVGGFAELAKGQEGEAKGFNYVNRDVERLLKEFAARYLQRENAFTGKTWAADPAIIAVLVTNENDLSDHFGALMLPDKKNPVHQGLFETQARAIIGERGLPPQPSMQTWKPGPGKVLLAELQHRFDARAIEHLRGLPTDALVATTSYWGRNNLWALPPLSAGDVVDVHSYGEEEALSANPHAESNFIHFIATASLTGKPVTVSEWNVPPPARDRFTAPLYVASIGALQGWDALMLFAYSQDPVAPPRRTGKWSAWTDPALIALGPAAAVMYRRGDVAAARETFVLEPSIDDVFGARRSAETSAALRSIAERSALRLRLPEHPALPWLSPTPSPAGATVLTDLDRDILDGHPRQVVSDTGELRRDWAAGVQTIDTARTQGVSGWVGDRAVRTSGAAFDLTTPKATAVFTSLDGKPLSSSTRVLLTVVARARPDATNTGWLAEPVRGTVALATEHTAMHMVPLSPTDRVKDAPTSRKAVPGTRRGGRVELVLPESGATHWFLLRAGS